MNPVLTIQAKMARTAEVRIIDITRLRDLSYYMNNLDKQQLEVKFVGIEPFLKPV